MRIVEVTDPATEKEFIEFPKRHYKNDPNWVCPLDIEIKSIFDPSKNISFREGEACRWILKDDRSKTIGRIAAFYDKKKINHFLQPTGGAGFFECVDDQKAANLLFDTAKEWLEAHNLKAMQAPVNFGENYNHWGCLVEGFNQPTYSLPYNYPYYQKLFENYGFRNYFEQYSYQKFLNKGWPARMLKFAQYVESRPNFTFEHFSFDKVDKYVDDFTYTYNTIWSGFHDNYAPLERKEIMKLIDESKMVLDEELIWFAYDNGKPAGLLMAFPDVNQILARLKNGKLTLINKLKFLYYRKRAITRSRSFIAGILPAYQNSGIFPALFYQMVKVLEKRPRHTITEMSWVGDYNPKMMEIYEKTGCERFRTHITYLKPFDPDAEFKRFDNEFEGKLYQTRNSLKEKYTENNPES